MTKRKRKRCKYQVFWENGDRIGARCARTIEGAERLARALVGKSRIAERATVWRPRAKASDRSIRARAYECEMLWGKEYRCRRNRGKRAGRWTYVRVGK